MSITNVGRDSLGRAGYAYTISPQANKIVQMSRPIEINHATQHHLSNDFSVSIHAREVADSSLDSPFNGLLSLLGIILDVPECASFN